MAAPGPDSGRVSVCARDRVVVTATLILHFISNVATVWCHLRCTCVINVRADSVLPCPCPALVHGSEVRSVTVRETVAPLPVTDFHLSGGREGEKKQRDVRMKLQGGDIRGKFSFALIKRRR